jgi:hypothetical protein
MADQPLPGMPQPPRAAAPTPREKETVSRFRGHRLCDACVFMIHRYGQAGAAFPRTARWRVAKPETESRYLCENHKETRL